MIKECHLNENGESFKDPDERSNAFQNQDDTINEDRRGEDGRDGGGKLQWTCVMKRKDSTRSK